MFDYHGWAQLCNDPHNSSGPNLDKLLVELKERLRKYDGIGVLDYGQLNVTFQIWLHGCTNHRQRWVFELFSFIAERAPGSYGLLYVWDDEDREHDNEFRVWRMARGRVEEFADPFLSPCVPTFEDPYDPEKDNDFDGWPAPNS